MKRTSIRKSGQSETAILQKECDSLITPIAKKNKPKCEACLNPTQVGHHWIEKSRSSNLRYNKDNIISLCHQCHLKIHNKFGNNVVGGLDIANLIIKRRGEKWYEQMKILGRKIVKTDVFWYRENLQRLKNILEK